MVKGMVEVLENNKKLIIKLFHSTSMASNFGERITEKRNVEVRRIRTTYDMNIVERTYEVIPLNENAEVKITIKDDNPNNWSAHTDHIIFRFNGQKWESTYLFHPDYH